MKNYNKPTIYDEIIELEDIIAGSPNEGSPDEASPEEGGEAVE